MLGVLGLGGCYEEVTVDASVPDASRRDAGGDAGRMDASPRDGGRTDGGLADGGPADGGPADADVGDAGLGDADVGDAGPGDAGADGGAADGGIGDGGIGDGGADAGIDPADPDGDGVPTFTEEACGTDPGDIDDRPRPDELRGAGTEADPYRVCLPEHLALLAAAGDVLTAHARLGDDLDMRGVAPPEPIGTEAAPFVGTFGGDGFVIDGLTVGTAGAPRAGLFAHVGSGGVLEDLVFTDALSFFGSVLVDRNAGRVRRVRAAGTIDADNHVGLVVNRNLAGGIVEDCVSDGAVRAVRSHIGGVVGRNAGLVLRCASSATVAGRNRVGGLVGSSSGIVRESLATGDVTGDGMWAGGLVGSARDGAVIEDGFALGDVTVTAGEAGGVLGNLEGTAALRRVYGLGRVDGSVASGAVLGVDASGGLGTVEMCYFDAAVASDPLCVGLAGAALGVADSYDGFDFVDVWRMDASVRVTPALAWEP